MDHHPKTLTAVRGGAKNRGASSGLVTCRLHRLHSNICDSDFPLKYFSQIHAKRRAAIWEEFSFAHKPTHHVESYKVQKLLEWNMAPRYCGEVVKKVLMGETNSLNPSKNDEICFWYIIEFLKWNMMSRYSARYRQGGRGGEESTCV